MDQRAEMWKTETQFVNIQSFWRWILLTRDSWKQILLQQLYPIVQTKLTNPQCAQSIFFPIR
jgi:hypothetical protein